MTTEKGNASIVRKKAEALLKLKKKNPMESVSEADLLKLSNELEIHQIELEIINEELLKAKEQSEATSQKYAELYYAPLGYFTISKSGEIIDVNPTGSQMLGREQRNLVNTPISDYLSDKSRIIFNLFFRKNIQLRDYSNLRPDPGCKGAKACLSLYERTYQGE